MMRYHYATTPTGVDLKDECHDPACQERHAGSATAAVLDPTWYLTAKTGQRFRELPVEPRPHSVVRRMAYMPMDTLIRQEQALADIDGLVRWIFDYAAQGHPQGDYVVVVPHPDSPHRPFWLI